MDLIRGLHNVRDRHRGCVATIGAFDGLHLGHQAVIDQLLERAKEYGLPSLVILFEPLPREYFAPQQAPPRLMSFQEKFRLLRRLGVDRVLRISFNRDFSSMSAEAFIDRVLAEQLGVKYLIVGDDLRFGADRRGDYALLQELGPQKGFAVADTLTRELDAERISSTRIRAALALSDFELAETLLGRPYSISGRVVFGQQLGRSLDAPTANVSLQRLRAPLAGVFAVEVAGDAGQGFTPIATGVANIGTRPTVDEGLKAILEVHLLDFEGDLYGRRIEVLFRNKIRDEVKFDSLDALKAQIHRDFDSGREFFNQ